MFNGMQVPATQDSIPSPPAWARFDGLETAIAWLNSRPIIAALVGLIVLFGVAAIAFAVIRRIVLRVAGRVAKRSGTFWDDVLIRQAFLHRLAWAVPLLIVYQGVAFVPHLPDAIETLLERLAVACLVLVAVRALAALLSGINEIYNRYPYARQRPIKGYLQVASIAIHLIAVILILAALMDRSPVIFFSGIGAMTAILLLIFRDTLLSLVAGIQLTSNDLIRVGDWIEMPQFGADGDVIDIALNSVRVQNWDRTFTVIPTHKFLEHSFKNWRGMEESGGRRIKRSLNIDMSTIRFLTDDEIERFGRFVLLENYVADKVKELADYDRAQAAEPGMVANARRLTNVGTLRAYIIQYLRHHPHIHQRMTFMVRQLQPTSQGLPLEIYVFSSDTAWVSYEGIQADIFDHILAMVPEFGMRVFQNPSGADVLALRGARAGLPPRQHAKARAGGE